MDKSRVFQLPKSVVDESILLQCNYVLVREGLEIGTEVKILSSASNLDYFRSCHEAKKALFHQKPINIFGAGGSIHLQNIQDCSNANRSDKYKRFRSIKILLGIQ